MQEEQITTSVLIPKIVDFKSMTQSETIFLSETDDKSIQQLQSLNLEDLVNISLNGTENLRNNFQTLIDAMLNTHSSIKTIKTAIMSEQQAFDQFKIKISDNFNQINKINEEIHQERLEQQIFNEKVKGQVKALETQSQLQGLKLKNELSEIQDLVGNLKQHSDSQKIHNQNLQSQIDHLSKQFTDSKLSSFDSELNSLKKQLGSFLDMAIKGGDENMGPVQMKIQSFQIQLDELNEKYNQLVHQNEFRPFKEQVITQNQTMLEMTNEHLPEKINQLEKRLDGFEQMMSYNSFDELKFQLMTKVNVKDYQDKIQQLEISLKNMAGSQGPKITSSGGTKQGSFSESDLMVLNKIPHLETEEMQQSFQQQVKQSLETFESIRENKLDKKDYTAYDESIQKNQNKEIKDQIHMMKDQMSRINQKFLNDECAMAVVEDRLNKLLIQIQEVDSAVKNFKNDDGKILEQQLRGMIEQLVEQMQAMSDKIDKKTTRQDITASEEGLLQKLDKCIEALIKKMADKNDTKKALLFLEKRINDLQQLSFERKQTNEDDPLIAKRPLFWSCVSCDIDVDKFRGKLGEYKNWAVFPPKETTPDRMGRFGIGYYNMMRNRKMGMQNERDKMAQIQTLMDSNNNLNEDLNVKSIDIQDKDESSIIVGKGSQKGGNSAKAKQ